MPGITVTLTGEIKEFDRIDNLFLALRREAKKMLTGWDIQVEAKYGEKEGEKSEE